MFWVLHIAAVLFYLPALFLTIPLHIITSMMAGRTVETEAPTPETHVRCPDCKELVRKDARICKHCRATLNPQP